MCRRVSGPPVRFAIKIPEKGGARLRLKTKDLGVVVVFSSLYAVLVIALAPFSYGPIQLRVADCLIPLAAIFGWPIALGVTIGAFIGNAYYWISIYDVVLGSIANLLAASTVILLKKKQLLACVVGSLPIGIIVGGYLWWFFPPPEIAGLSLPVWLAMIISITVSTLIAMAVFGYILLKAINRAFERISR